MSHLVSWLIYLRPTSGFSIDGSQWETRTAWVSINQRIFGEEASNRSFLPWIETRFNSTVLSECRISAEMILIFVYHRNQLWFLRARTSICLRYASSCFCNIGTWSLTQLICSLFFIRYLIKYVLDTVFIVREKKSFLSNIQVINELTSHRNSLCIVAARKSSLRRRNYQRLD